jgi:glycosyltransferase involved in cell wall biosynthesis
MATMGGPVLFLRGSLLDRFFPQDAAARCFSIQDAHDKCNRLLHGDMIFRNQIIKESRDVVRRYHPKYVWPVFDKKIKEAIFQNNKHATWLSSFRKMRIKTNKHAKSFYIFNHFPGRIINFKKGEYSSAEGIPRVLRKMILALCSQKQKINLYITCGPKDIAFAHGYFIEDNLQRNINILPLIEEQNQFSNFRAEWKRLWNKAIRLIPSNIFQNANKVRKQIKEYAISKLGLNKKHFPFDAKLTHALIKEINSDPDCQAVLIPHYYLFPEAILLKKKSILYLPDYLPWLFPKNKEFIEIRSKYESIGKSISKRAAAIMTNSNFTKKYLSNCPLKIEKNKIHVVPLPLLMNSTTRSSHNMTLVLPEKFIFYPTQQRPNKQIGDLLKVFSILRKSYKDLFLVLTSDPAQNEDVKVDFLKCADRKNIVILPRISDYELSMTYRKAKVLAFTSSAEGNFPPQIFEAIAFDTPVVAFRHEFIYEAIPPALESCLMLAEPGNIQDFVDKVIYAIKNSKAVTQKQKRLLKLLSEANSFKSLSCSIGKVLEKIQGINSLKY